MVKKLQALKAKKGFTLVELVVVIAIIGVLAAILIPTMIGVVQDSRISSADTAASQIRTQVTSWLTKADTAGHTFQGPDSETAIGFSVTGGAWTLASATSASGSTSGTTSTNGSFLGTGWAWSGDDKETNFTAFAANALSDIKNAYIEVVVDKEKCIGVSYIEGVSAKPDGVTMPLATEYKSDAAGTCAAFENKAGVSGNVVIGTNPKLTKTTVVDA